jgi:hypothetical protein
MHETSDDRSHTGLAWGALAIAVMVVCVWGLTQLPGEIGKVASALRDDDLPYVTGALSGSALIRTVVVWAVLYFAATRRWAPGRGPLFFLILLVVTTATNIGATLFAKSVAETHNRDLQTQTAMAEADLKSAFAAIKANPSTAVIDQHVNAQGDAGIVEGITKRYLATVLKDRQDYRAALAATGFPNFLTPANLAAHKGLTTARVELARCRELVKTYSGLGVQRGTEYRAAIQSSRIAEPLKNQALQSIDAGLARSEPLQQRHWILEDSLFADFEKIAALLAHPRDSWTVNGRTFRFVNHADLEDYNALVHDVQAAAAEEKALHADAVQQSPN